MNHSSLNDSLVALLGAIVATSVFTIGFVAHRSHVARIEIHRWERERPGESGSTHERLIATAFKWVRLLN